MTRAVAAGGIAELPLHVAADAGGAAWGRCAAGEQGVDSLAEVPAGRLNVVAGADVVPLAAVDETAAWGLQRAC